IASEGALVTQPGQLEATPATAERDAPLVSDEERGIGCRVIVVAQLEKHARTAALASEPATTQTMDRASVGARRAVTAIRADEPEADHEPRRIPGRDDGSRWSRSARLSRTVRRRRPVRRLRGAGKRAW